MFQLSVGFFCAVLAAAALCSKSTAGTIHEVNLVIVAFEPATVIVEAGDTIRWIRNTSSHTVTSGDGCVADGVWFDVPLNGATPIFEWVVPAEAPSKIPYFCIPHCAAFGMEGTIIVGSGCEGDVDGDGLVGFADLIEVLSAWGPCSGCVADIDSNNIIDFGDVLIVLSNWGDCG